MHMSWASTRKLDSSSMSMRDRILISRAIALPPQSLRFEQVSRGAALPAPKVRNEMEYAGIEELQEALQGASYLPDRGLATALFLSLRLEKPLLLEGEAGVGKTEAAKALPRGLGARPVPLPGYQGPGVAHAVYEWNYPRPRPPLRAAPASTISQEQTFR